MRNIICIALTVILALSFPPACAYASDSSRELPKAGNADESSERAERARAAYREVFGDMGFPLYETNPDYGDIINRFIYGDIYNQSDLLDLRQRQLITLVSLTVNRSYELLRLHIRGALNVGLTPDQILEAIYHCTPYAGIAVTYDAVASATKALQENGVSLPLKSQRQVGEGRRFEEGAAVQRKLYGINPVRNGNFIGEYVTEYCFGDFYTRGAIDLKTRQLLTMCVLANMGLPQLSAHVRGSHNAGYSKDEIIAAITQCMPYMGVPRTLNAMATVNEVIPAETDASSSGSPK